MITGNRHAKLDIYSVVALLDLGIFEEVAHIFGILDIPAKLLPYMVVEYIMVTSILSVAGGVHSRYF